MVESDIRETPYNLRQDLDCATTFLRRAGRKGRDKPAIEHLFAY